jgi:hypothetical protein
MTDDIVTRLREGCIECGLPAHYTACVLEAADEIERLRIDLDYWHEKCTRAEACADIMHNKLNKKWWKR